MDIAVEGRTSATNGWSTLVRPKRKMAMSPGVRRTRARLPLPRQSAKRTCPKGTSHAVHRGLAYLGQANAHNGQSPGRSSHASIKGWPDLARPKRKTDMTLESIV